MTTSSAWKRYKRRAVWLSLAYALLLLLAVYGFKRHLLSGPLAWLAAVFPALPLIGIFAAIGRYLIEEQDEYVRMLMVRQSLWASAFALTCATVWGFLEAFDLVGHIDSYYIAVLWFAGLGFGACVNKLTLGTAVHC